MVIIKACVCVLACGNSALLTMLNEELYFVRRYLHQNIDGIMVPSAGSSKARSVS